VILSALRSVEFHPTAADLYEIVRRQLPRISLGTVYRNLDQLAEAGEITRLEIAGAAARFDGETRPHHHVRCVHCGRVDDVLDVPDSIVPNDTTTLGGYDILHCRLEFVGVCGSCRKGRP
jgi:Fur family ferric uptake transcriptional regulator